MTPELIYLPLTEEAAVLVLAGLRSRIRAYGRPSRSYDILKAAVDQLEVEILTREVKP